MYSFVVCFSQGFYAFLFAHPILIVKNPHWFNMKSSADILNDHDWLNDTSTNTVHALKQQLVVLSKLYRNELQTRPASLSIVKQKSTGSNIEHDNEQFNAV
jgi:hypothetical protein